MKGRLLKLQNRRSDVTGRFSEYQARLERRDVVRLSSCFCVNHKRISMSREKLLLVALLCCCCFSEEGFPLTAESSSSSSGEDETTFSSGSSASVSTTSQGSSSSSSTDPETSESSEGSSSESGSETTESSTGEPAATDYTPCSMSMDPACESPADTCIWTDGVAEGIAPAGWCARSCNDGANATDCPLGTSGTSTASCTYYGALPLKCMLRCDEGKVCPDGMTCVEHVVTPEYGNEYVFVCAWPA